MSDSTVLTALLVFVMGMAEERVEARRREAILVPSMEIRPRQVGTGCQEAEERAERGWTEYASFVRVPS